MLWVFNLAILIVNRIFEGYSFSLFGLVAEFPAYQKDFLILKSLFIMLLRSFNILDLVDMIRQQLAFLDNYRGTFRWHICFNLGKLEKKTFLLDFFLLQSSCSDDLKYAFWLFTVSIIIVIKNFDRALNES